jgi:hypothetical protein
VREGTYSIKVTKGKDTYASQIQLVPDRRSQSTAADRALQHRTVMQLYDMLGQLTFVVDATNDLRDQARQRSGNATDSGLKDQLNNLVQKLEDFRSTLVSVKEGGMITGEKKLRERLGELYGGVNGYCGRPTQSQIDSTAAFQRKLDEAASQFQSIIGPALQSLNTRLEGQNLEPLKAMSRDDWEKKQK